MQSFMMGTTSSTIMQSLGEIEQRAPAVGAKMWCFRFYCVLFYFYYCVLLCCLEQWVASFDGLWPFWQPTTVYKHIILYVIDVFASGK